MQDSSRQEKFLKVAAGLGEGESAYVERNSMMEANEDLNRMATGSPPQGEKQKKNWPIVKSNDSHSETAEKRRHAKHGALTKQDCFTRRCLNVHLEK